ncbi:hypothetical protein Drorol1_Dr00000332, partial [Drosera rotundifolia]
LRVECSTRSFGQVQGGVGFGMLCCFDAEKFMVLRWFGRCWGSGRGNVGELRS